MTKRYKINRKYNGFEVWQLTNHYCGWSYEPIKLFFHTKNDAEKYIKELRENAENNK